MSQHRVKYINVKMIIMATSSGTPKATAEKEETSKYTEYTTHQKNT